MTDNLLNQIRKISAKNVKMANGKTYEQNLIHEAKRLKAIIRRHLDQVRNIHIPDPKNFGYKRTYIFPHSLKVDDIVNMRILGNTIELDVYFDPNGNVRESGFGITTLAHDEEDNEIPWRSKGEMNLGLMYEFGYQVEKDVWFKDIPFFGYRSGTHFLTNAIDEFNSNNPLGIKVYCPVLGLYYHRRFPDA